MAKDNLFRMAGAAAVSCLAMAGPGATSAMAQSPDGHNQSEVVVEHTGHAEQGHGNKTAASESDWLKSTVDDAGAHTGHGEQANAGHDDHGAIAGQGECDHVNHTGNCDHSQKIKTAGGVAADTGHDQGNQPVLSEADWMKAPVVDHSKQSGSEHAAHTQN